MKLRIIKANKFKPMLAFEEREKPECLEKNLLVQSRDRTNKLNTHMTLNLVIECGHMWSR